MALDTGPRNWKREPLVWMLIAIPSSAVVMGVLILLLSINSYSGLVVDDYYQKGKQINRVLARDSLAWELGLAAELELLDDDMIRVRLPENSGAWPGGQKMRLDLVHATIPGRDIHLEFERGQGNFTLAPDALGDGRWNVYLHTADWRLTGSLRRPSQSRVWLRPNYQPAGS